MLTIMGLGMAWLALMVLAGAPLAAWIENRILAAENRTFSLFLAISLICGFFYSSIAVGWSYGFLGIDNYPLVLILLLVFSWVLAFVKGFAKDILLSVRAFKKADFVLILVPIISIILTKPQIESVTKASLRAGIGPDTPQNVMAALSARTLGSTWFQQAQNFTNYFDVPSLRKAILNLYQYPSFRDQAGFDYLVYGSRWGLTVPYSHVIKYFGNGAALWETGISLFVGLCSVGIVAYAASALINKKLLMRNSVMIFAICSSPFLFQVFNGGLSQSWAAVGILGVSLAAFGIYLPSIESNFSKREYLGWSVLFAASFSILFATYVDALIILGLFLILLGLAAFTLNKKRAIFFIKTIVTATLIALIVSPVLTYATLLTFDLRLKAAQGTGAPTAIWPLPSELVGLINVFSPDQLKRTPETLLIAILLSLFLVYSIAKLLVSKSELDRSVAYLGLAGLVMMFLGFLLSIFGRLGNDYIYLKVSQYVSYIVVISFAYSLFPAERAKNKSSGKTSYGLALVTYTALAATTALVTTWDLSKTGTNIPSAFSKIMNDVKVQDELSKYNYLTTYTSSSNIFGILGNVHWISKAPNDQVLKERSTLELRLICFAQDTTCKPTTPLIPSPNLNQFGIQIFESPITTQDFLNLGIKDRYDINFISFGQKPQQIPERYLGGNPYYR